LTSKSENEKRVDRIRRLLGCKSDVELAKKLETQQPQISRWRRGELSKSMVRLIDELVSTIGALKREKNRLKKELDDLKKS
jgi:hypothetical protein